jgi:hypothetical protein
MLKPPIRNVRFHYEWLLDYLTTLSSVEMDMRKTTKSEVRCIADEACVSSSVEMLDLSVGQGTTNLSQNRGSFLCPSLVDIVTNRPRPLPLYSSASPIN